VYTKLTLDICTRSKCVCYLPPPCLRPASPSRTIVCLGNLIQIYGNRKVQKRVLFHYRSTQRTHVFLMKFVLKKKQLRSGPVFFWHKAFSTVILVQGRWGRCFKTTLGHLHVRATWVALSLRKTSCRHHAWYSPW